MSDTISPKIEAELKRIYERDGLLQAAAVVRDARDPDNPLHTQFTWDDGLAAERWRRAEAEELIRKAKIIVIKEPDVVKHVRAYVSVEHDGSRGYMPIQRALEEHSDQVFERALLEIEQMRQRYQNFVDFNDVLRRALEAA